MTISLPRLPRPDVLGDLCREAAARQRVPAASLEKDLYLTRLLWALGDRFGDGLLLKGGTCLMKVDVGFRRMSEDIDLVIPWSGSLNYKGTNASYTNRIRDALRELGPIVGVQLETPDGQAWVKRSHVRWTVHYPSEFGRTYPGQPQPTATIDVEVAMRPVMCRCAGRRFKRCSVTRWLATTPAPVALRLTLLKCVRRKYARHSRVKSHRSETTLISVYCWNVARTWIRKSSSISLTSSSPK